MVKLHLAPSQDSAPRWTLRPKKVRVAFERSPAFRILRGAHWHIAGLALAAIMSLLLWIVIAALVG